MARRSVLQEIPIPVPQTEQQSYDIILEEEEDSPPYNKLISAERPHAIYISNDETKENITPIQFEDIFKEKGHQVQVLESGDVGDELRPSSFGQTSDVDMSTPKRKTEGCSDEPQPCNTPMDFSTVTVGDLGISSESFTTKCAGKSPKSLHKHRRRSTIGVRGSPEMNFLIRQIALQRCNRKSEPEPLDNPFTSPRNSILREKISAFRNAFQTVEETEGKLTFPGFSEVEELEVERAGEVRSEPPEKKKKVCDLTDPWVSSAPPKPSQPLQIFQKFVPEKTFETDCDLASRLSTEDPSKPVEVQRDETQILPTSSRCRKRKDMIEGLLSPPEAEPSLLLISEDSLGLVLKPALKKTPIANFVHSLVGFRVERTPLFSLQESTESDIDNKPEDSIKKRKKVTFGRDLSPELFDKSLPANTPLRRGSTPYSHQKLDTTPSAELSPCQSPCEPMPQPDFDDRDEETTLQPLSLCFDIETSDSDSPPASSLPDHAEEEEAADLTRSLGDDQEPVTSSDETADLVNESFLLPPEVSLTESRRTRSSDKQKLTSAEETPQSSGSKSKVKSTAKKTRKHVIKKVQMKAPCGKGNKKGGKSKKSLQKPVHSERVVVSKRPLLSPIPELTEDYRTPPASTSMGKVLHKGLVKKLRAGKVHSTLGVPRERNIEEKNPHKPSVSIVEDVQTQDASVDPALEDMKVSDNGSPENSEDLANLDVLDLSPVSSECPLSTMDMEVTDQLSKQATSGLPEKISKAKNTKRRSSTRMYASVSSEITVECINQDEDADHTSHKPEISIDPVPGKSALSSMSNEPPTDGTTTSFITTDHKKSRRSSRNHQLSNILSATTPGENSCAILPPPIDHSDSSMDDFCLPIDEVLQFPQQEKKVRRSMRLRRDSGVIGLSWVQEIQGSDMAGRRKSISSVTSSASTLENMAQSPNKENVSSCLVSNVARRTRRRTLCTTTIQESVPTCDKKRRRSNCFHKARTTTSAGDEVIHITVIPDA